MTVTEPMTMVTDYVMGGMATILAARLAGHGAAGRQAPVVLWAGLFACTALASFLGGTYHGFIQMLPQATAHLLWQGTLYATGVASACLLGAATVAGTAGVVRRVLLAVVAVKLLGYLWWMSSHTDFLFVIVDYGSALLATMVVVWTSRTGGMRQALPWLNAGAAVAVVAALIQALRLAPHPQFNHNDLFHVVQMGALYLLYRAGLLLRDEIPTSESKPRPDLNPPRLGRGDGLAEERR